VDSDVQICEPDGGQKGLDICFGPGVSIFWEGFGNSANKGLVILPYSANHLEDVVFDNSGEVNQGTGRTLILLTRKVIKNAVGEQPTQLSGPA
jgi:hypothetical protein